MINYFFDVLFHNLNGEKIVKEEFSAFISQYFPEILDNQIYILITSDVSKVIFQFCEKAGLPAEFIPPKSEGCAKEINNIIYLFYDYKLVGFPHIYVRQNSYDMWNGVKKYIIHHELQHIINKKNYQEIFKSTENFKVPYFCALLLDEYFAIYESLLIFGNSGVLPFYLNSTNTLEDFTNLITIGYSELRTEIQTYKPINSLIDNYVNLLLRSYSKIIAFHHANVEVNSIGIIDGNTIFESPSLKETFLNLERNLNGFNTSNSTTRFAEIIKAVENIFLLFSE